jgi:broad-like protein
LKWNNFSDNILTSLENLWGDEDFVDVTIACDGQSLKAHKVVLSACSSYMKRLLKVSDFQLPQSMFRLLDFV